MRYNNRNFRNNSYTNMYGTPNMAMFANVLGVKVDVYEFQRNFEPEKLNRMTSIVFEAGGFLHNLVYTTNISHKKSLKTEDLVMETIF